MRCLYWHRLKATVTKVTGPVSHGAMHTCKLGKEIQVKLWSNLYGTYINIFVSYGVIYATQEFLLTTSCCSCVFRFIQKWNILCHLVTTNKRDKGHVLYFYDHSFQCDILSCPCWGELANGELVHGVQDESFDELHCFCLCTHRNAWHVDVQIHPWFK